MKKKYYSYWIGCVWCMLPVGGMGQSLLTVDRGETVELTAPEGFQTYQWQVSSDKKAFADIPGGSVRKLKICVNAPGYYRVKASSAAGAEIIPDTTEVCLKTVRYAESYTLLSAGHGYVETRDGKPGASGISIPEEERKDGQALVTKKLTNWTSGNAMAVYYFNHPRDTVDTQMYLAVKRNADVHFRVTVWDPTDLSKPMAENYMALKGTGRVAKCDMMGLVLPRKDYYRYQIECLKGWNDIIEIDSFRLNSHSKVRSYKAGWLSSPSVHLNNWRSTKSGVPSSARYDWCYQEVMMPEESDIVGTYIMSLGVLSGYMGIQMNGWKDGKSLHEVIYSMWDDGSTDEDPNLPDYCRASVVDHDEKATVNRFGGEGTGMQTFYRGHHWECGSYVQFITNCRPEEATYTIIVDGKEVVRKQNNMLVSTWFNAQDGKGWQYMSTLRLPNNNTYFKSWYSFLENYNWPTGQAVRTGYYRNGYARSKDTEEWYHFNSVGFGHTDGGQNPGNRNDYGQGVSSEDPGAFFMTNGGYLPTVQKGKIVPLNKQHTPVDTINLNRLEARVDEAIAREREKIEEAENFKKNKFDKSAWEVVRFSSEETTGEDTNGRARQIIDGDNNTYWHSKWTGGGSSYPHFFVVDMKEEKVVNGFQITMSGGSNRYIKSFNLYASGDGVKWNKFYADADAPSDATFHFMLEEPVSMRYFKLEITGGRATDGNHVRVNEIEVTGPAIPTAIKPILSAAGKLEVACLSDALLITSPSTANNVQISLYGTNGACVYSKHYKHLSAKEQFRVPMVSVPKGVYVVACGVGGKNYSKQFVWVAR